MDIEWARLIADHVVSWPVAAISIALLFRRSLTDLLNSITTAKIGPVELERQLDALKREAETLKELNDLLLKVSEMNRGLVDNGEPHRPSPSAEELNDLRSAVSILKRQFDEHEKAIESLARNLEKL